MCVAAGGLTAAQMFWTSLAVTAASTAFNYAGQQQQAEAQAKYQRQLAEQQNEYILQNAEAANAAYIEESAAQTIKMGQQQEAASEELQDLQRERLQAQGTAVATSEAAGLSYNLLMRDYLREEARYRNNVRRQLEWDWQEGSRLIAGYRSKAIDRANSVQPYTPSPVSSPSLLGAGLQIAGGAFDAYGKYTTKDPNTGKRTFG